MPFGLSGAPAHFAFLMSRVLDGLIGDSCLAYLDHVIILDKDAKDMERRIEEVLNRLRGAHLRIHPQKCKWACNQVTYLGFEFSANGIQPDRSKLGAVRDFKPCSNPKEVKSLVLTSYFRRFIKDFSKITAPLRDLLKKDATFVWTLSCQQAFDYLKDRLTSAPILMLPNFDLPFAVHYDA